MYFSTLLKTAVTAVSLIYSVEAAANIFPVNAVGDVVAAADSTTSGITHVYYQDKDDGAIKVLCTSTAFVQGGSQTCLAGSESRVAVPANETLYGTPLAVVKIFAGDHLFYFTPNWTLAELIADSFTGQGSDGTECGSCITKNEFPVEPNTRALYAIDTTSSDNFRRRVGFISRGNPDTITEATFNVNTQKWSLAVMPE